MSGYDRAVYIDEACPGEHIDFEWQVIIDVETGVAYSMACPGGFDIPRMEIAALIEAGALP